MLPHVPGADTAMVDFKLREAAIEYFERSQAWRYIQVQVPVVALTKTYAYIPPSPTETEVHVITYAEFNDLEIGTEVSEFSSRYYDWRNNIDQPRYVIGGLGDCTLVPIPIANGTLDLIVAIKPTIASTGIFNDKIFNENRLGIMHGAIWKLMLIPKVSYSNPEMALYHSGEFDAEITAAGIRVDLEFTNAPLQTGLRTFRRNDTQSRINRDT
ncbi:hypothetical protein KAR91_03135 [Candidatus Pacearchaeota archaeon]|nr:hypothetical protein [Candidatus Pacearchaeota archaeon]